MVRDSVDSDVLNHLLQSLRIGHGDAYADDSDASSSDGDSSASYAVNYGQEAPAAAPASPGATPPAPPAAPAPPPAPPVEVIDLVDSTDEEDEEQGGGGGGTYAPPSTARRPITLIDSSSDEEAVESGEGSDDDDDWAVVPPSTARRPINLIDSDDDEEEEESGGGSDSGSENEVIVIEDTPQRSVVPSLDAILRRAGADLDAAAARRPAARRPPPPALPPALPPAALQWAPQSHAAFVRARSQMARDLYDKYNGLIFGGRLPPDLDISWNKRLSTTAGLTHYRRETASGGGPPRYAARVELSCKVVDAAEKLERTLVHEMCHCAAWLLDHVAKPPHGPAFKAWAARAVAAAPHLDVSTCHAYDIFYAHQWQCTGCAQVYGRHSRSIDETKKVCGVCRGRLTYLGRMTREGAPAKARAPSAFNLFVKEHYGEAARALGPGAGAAEVMRELTARWKAKQAREAAGGQGKQAGASGGSGSGASSGGAPSGSAGSTVQALLGRLNIS